MAWADAVADFASVRSDVFGEGVAFETTGVPAVSIRATWGRIEKADTGQGYVADTAAVQVPAADLVSLGRSVVPARGVTSWVTRFPTDLARRERWLLSDVSQLDASTWELRVWRVPDATVQRTAF